MSNAGFIQKTPIFLLETINLIKEDFDTTYSMKSGSERHPIAIRDFKRISSDLTSRLPFRNKRALIITARACQRAPWARIPVYISSLLGGIYMKEGISASRFPASTSITSSCFHSGPQSTTKTSILTSGFCQKQRAAKPCATVCINCWLRATGECGAHSAGDNLSFTGKLREQIQNSVLRSAARDRSYVYLLCFVTPTKT
jgi:hypothetical protein